MSTGWTAVRLGLPGFLLPFLFVYHPELLLEGTVLSCASVIVSCVLGLFCMAVFFEGYFFTRLNWAERIAIAIASFLLVKPGTYSDLIGLAIFLLLLFEQRTKKAKLAAVDKA